MCLSRPFVELSSNAWVGASDDRRPRDAEGERGFLQGKLGDGKGRTQQWSTLPSPSKEGWRMEREGCNSGHFCHLPKKGNKDRGRKEATVVTFAIF